MDCDRLIIAMSYPGFYKFDNELLQYASTSVYAPGFTLTAANHADYIYPIDDWYWFDSRQTAEAFWEINGQSNAQWVQFAQALAGSDEIKALLWTTEAVNPVLREMLGVGLGQAAQGNSRTFLAAWGDVVAAGLVSTELAAQMQSLAAGFDLPAEFMEGLG